MYPLHSSSYLVLVQAAVLDFQEESTRKCVEYIQGILYVSEEKDPVIFSGPLIKLQVIIQNEVSRA